MNSETENSKLKMLPSKDIHTGLSKNSSSRPKQSEKSDRQPDFDQIAKKKSLLKSFTLGPESETVAFEENFV